MKDYKIAPEDSSQWKCNWLSCAGGMGLAGAGICSFRGDWSDPNCPDFITMEAYERKCHLEYVATHPWWVRMADAAGFLARRFRLWIGRNG